MHIGDEMIDLKNKVFLDSDGEMTFENKERLNFIMHFMKQGAVEQVATNKDGTFVREDAEISFNEIWLPCAESKQAEIEVLKTKLAKAQAVPEGFVLIKDDTKTVVAIERMVEQQVEASGMDSRRLERLDGWKIIEAAVKAQEPQITELKVEWASDCFKCGHHEAIIYSTSAEASTKGWFHDGDEVKCTGCGNTGEMDTHGEDSDICWNEDEAND